MSLTVDRRPTASSLPATGEPSSASCRRRRRILASCSLIVVGLAVFATNFPSRFLFLGQGYVGGVVPTQLFVLAITVVAMWWSLHRTAYGRTLYAIGHAPEGARYAGIRVNRRLATVYVLSGLASSVAAVIYVAHLGQAKSDAARSGR